MEPEKITLDQLFEAALVDGVITEKEKNVILKKAEKEGYDPDEVEMLLDAKIQKLNMQQHTQRPKVKKCPNCGEPIAVLSLTCPTCGYEFKNEKGNSSFMELSNKIMEVEKHRKIYNDSADGEERQNEAKRIANIKSQVINTFPVPNTKDDLIEFITMGLGQTQKKTPYLDSAFMRVLIVAVVVLVLGLLVMLFMIVFGMEGRKFENCGIVGAVMFYALMIGGGLVAMSGGNATRLEHNMLADAWEAKIRQCWSKAKLLIQDPTELNRLNELMREQHIKEPFSLINLLKGLIGK